MSIVMTGGGTGGHLAIIKAVKEHLKESEFVYVGSPKGRINNGLKMMRILRKHTFLKQEVW